MESLKARGALTSDWEMRNHDLSDQSCFCFHLELWEIWQRLRETQSLALPVWTEASRVIAMKMDEIIFKNREGDQCKKLQGKNLNNKLYFLFCYIYNNVQYGHLFQKKSSTFLQLFCVWTLSSMFTIQLQMSCCVLFLQQQVPTDRWCIVYNI